MACVLTPVDRIFKDLQECISCFQQEFQESELPVTDDNTLLHRFCAKLEFLLQHGQKEKTSLLGAKKEYWDFFCACLRSHRSACEGLRFVKSKSEIKTSLGRGRGFIRFCLVHKCLADTLQHCFADTKITKEWYNESAIWCMADKWPILVAALYEINHVNFALSPEGLDLDVSWPTFARKVFDVQYSWQPPSRSISISSLISQNEFTSGQSLLSSQEEECDGDELKLELAQSRSEISELSAKLVRAHQREDEMAKSIVQLEKELQQKDGLEMQSETDDVVCEKTALERKQLELEKNIKFLESELSLRDLNIKDLNSSLQSLRGLNKDLEEKLSSACWEHNNTITKLNAMSKVVEDFKDRLDATENDLSEVTSGKNDLLLKLDKMQSANENMKQLVTVIEDKNQLLEKEAQPFKEAAQNYEVNLRKANEKNEKLSSQLTEVSSSLQDFSHQIDIKGIELETAQQKIKVLEEKVDFYVASSNDSKILELVKKVDNLESLNTDLLKEKELLISKCESTIEEKDALLSEKVASIKDNLEAQLLDKSRQLDEANAKLAVLQSNTEKLIPFLEKQELLIDNLKSEMSKMLMAAQKLSHDLNELMPLVHNATKKETKDNESCSDFIYSANGVSSQDSFDSACESVPAMSLASETSNVLLGEVDVHFFPLIRTIHRIIAKLRGLLKKQNGMEHVMSTCHNVSSTLFNVLSDYERKVITVSSLEIAHNAIKGLTKEHQKLQAAEAILRYELREKRKLLTRLRQQLEATRDEWRRVKNKNAESQNEWFSLREEFAKRYKQPSEESGFVDGVAEHSETSSVIVEPTGNNILEGEPEQIPNRPDALENISAVCEGAEGSSETCTEVDGEPPPRSRLETMEEECQQLYSSLLRSSQRSEFLVQRLNLLLSPSDHSSDSSKDGSPFPTEIIPPEDEPVSQNHVPYHSDVCSIEHSDATTSLHSHYPGDDVLLSSSPNSVNFSDLQETSEISEFQEDDLSMRRADAASEAVRRKRALESLVKHCKQEKLEMENREAELKEQVQQTESENILLKGKVAKLLQEKNEASKKDNEFRKRAEFIFRHERDASDVRLHTLTEEKVVLEKDLKEVQEQLQIRTDHVSSLEKELEHVKQICNEEKELHKQDLTALRFQLSTEALKYERSLKNYMEQESGISTMNEKVNDQEQLIQSLEMTLSEIQEDRRTEQEQRWQELEELQFMLTARDEECIALNEEAKKAVKDLDETKNTLSKLLVQSTEQEKKSKRAIGTLQMELLQWKNDSEELKVQIIKLTKDKDTLWKKTEKLSHLQQLQTADRWMDDSEAINCLICKAAFSFTLRKHHCRLCGRIFCHSCTNNWLLIASSSRKVRACLECYKQQMDLYSREGASDDEEEGPQSRAVIIATNPPPRDTQSLSLPVVAPGKGSRANIVSSLPVHIMRMWRSPSPSSASILDTAEEIENEDSNLSKSDEAPKIEFDVISDEEIARSLSACSPYAPQRSFSASSQSKLHLSAARRADDIEKSGIEGELWVNAGTVYGLPVIIDHPGQVLFWEFKSEPKSVVFSVLYRATVEGGDDEENWDVLLSKTRVQSHSFPIQGHLVAKRAGVYLLVFNNHFSRFMAKKVAYKLKVNNENSTSCSSIEEVFDEN